MLAVAVGLVAALLATLGSWHVSLWSDEVATASAAERDLDDLGRLVDRIDAVHGSYYLLMHGWVEVFGASPVSLRLPSAIAVGLAAAGVLVLGRRLADVPTALMAALVFAVLPRTSWAGIEARPFALSIAAAVWLTVTLHAAVTRHAAAARRSWPHFTLYALLLGVGTVINLYVALLAGAHLVTLLLRTQTRRAMLPTALAAAAGVLVASPVVREALGQGGQLGSRRPGPLTVARDVLVNQWFLGETPTPTTASGASLAGPDAIWKVAALLLAAACWGLIVWVVAAAVRSRTAEELLVWTVPWLLVPTAAVLAYSVLSPSVYNSRYLGFCAPAVALLVAAALRRLAGLHRAAGLERLPGLRLVPARRLPFVALVVLAAVALPVYLSQRTTTAKSGADLALVAEHLEGRAAPGDGVYFGPRDAPRDGVVLRSLRTVSIGYPEPFEGLVDVTLLAGPDDGATLFGTSATLEGSVDRLEDLDRLWVLRREDQAAQAEADDRLLREAGFTVVDVWDGPQTEVLELVRP